MICSWSNDQESVCVWLCCVYCALQPTVTETHSTLIQKLRETHYKHTWNLCAQICIKLPYFHRIGICIVQKLYSNPLTTWLDYVTLCLSWYTLKDVLTIFLSLLVSVVNITNMTHFYNLVYIIPLFILTISLSNSWTSANAKPHALDTFLCGY